MNSTPVQSHGLSPKGTELDRPIFIVSTPRSASTLLFETLAHTPGIFTPADESHGRIERIKGLGPASRGWTSNRLAAEDATEAIIGQLTEAFVSDLRDRDGNRPSGSARMLEKTPKNALRVPFFNAVWPDSSFVYLYRDVRQTLASMMEAWISGGFRTYPNLPGWSGYPWSLLLVPGWRELVGLPLPEIVAHQWAITTNILIDDLKKLPNERVRIVRHEDFISMPQPSIQRLTQSLDLHWDRELGRALPMSKYTLSRPHPDKWRRLEPAINSVLPIVEEADASAREFIECFVAESRH
jgi:sulfotransferase family protein